MTDTPRKWIDAIQAALVGAGVQGFQMPDRTITSLDETVATAILDAIVPLIADDAYRRGLDDGCIETAEDWWLYSNE